MSRKLTENLISSCLIEPTTDLAMFSTTFSIDSTEYESNVEELGIFGDFQSAIISMFDQLGFPLLVSRIKVFDLFSSKEKILPQSIVMTYYPSTPQCFFFVISNKVISIDKTLEITGEYHDSIKDSIKYYTLLRKEGSINVSLQDFLMKNAKLQHFASYLDYKIYNLPSNFFDKAFNLEVTPLKITFERKNVTRSNILQPEILQNIKFDNKILKEASTIPKIPPLFDQLIEGLSKLTQEGMIKFGKFAKRDYNLLYTDLDTVIFELDKFNGKYLIFHKISEAIKRNSEERDIISFNSLSYASSEMKHPTTANNHGNSLRKVMEKVLKLSLNESEDAIGDLIHRFLVI